MVAKKPVGELVVAFPLGTIPLTWYVEGMVNVQLLDFVDRNAGMPCYWMDGHGGSHIGITMKCWIVAKKRAMTMTLTRCSLLAQQPSAMALGLLPPMCFNASTCSLTRNTLVSNVCMLPTQGKTSPSILWKVRYQSAHQA